VGRGVGGGGLGEGVRHWRTKGPNGIVVCSKIRDSRFEIKSTEAKFDKGPLVVRFELARGVVMHHPD
jgi:hypothetical protein